jgi:alpha-glucosidase/alpha-D-xyloside xylohydrolase
VTNKSIDNRPSRRDMVRAAGGAGLVIAAGTSASGESSQLRVAGAEVEIQITEATPWTTRISVVGLKQLDADALTGPGSLVSRRWPEPARRIRSARAVEMRLARQTIRFKPEDLSLTIQEDGRLVQVLRFDQETGAVRFRADCPLLGLGEGGPQFDRRGFKDSMRSGQGVYKLRTHGGRVPVPWIVGTAGWAMLFHQPYGAFDLTGTDATFEPSSPQLPLDLFVVASNDPERIMAEYAYLTGFAEMPPLWSLGYQQSHRTLASREEVIGIARTFREKKLPCDALIYLGTGFCPSGWNTTNGSFSFNRDVFTDPRAVIDELRAQHFHVVLHSVILSRTLRGSVREGCEATRFDEEQAACHWDAHRKVFALGVDGWWPDEGDPLDPASRLVRNRMYWEGPLLDRPNERPYALHRNGYAGMQRYGAFLWSGDVHSTWETLRTHVPIAINTGLSGIPYWGTDIGGFIPTKELTGELYVRWFQFGAFNPLFRAHGRTWKLRLPWGWNAGELGPDEIKAEGDVANPGPDELHNAQVEPICRKYLELRYRLMPYLYSAVRECCRTGLPVIRALWLHYPNDPKAAMRSDEYLWGRDILVAPIVEKGATSRKVYLPAGAWHDFWTGEKHEGGREISRTVDLETVPLYVRAGAIIPFGPLKQYTAERVDGSFTMRVYPGADGECAVYEDDGSTFDYREGAWMGLRVSWSDRTQVASVRLADGSRMLPPGRRTLDFALASGQRQGTAVFDGSPLEVRL